MGEVVMMGGGCIQCRFDNHYIIIRSQKAKNCLERDYFILHNIYSPLALSYNLDSGHKCRIWILTDGCPRGALSQRDMTEKVGEAKPDQVYILIFSLPQTISPVKVLDVHGSWWRLLVDWLRISKNPPQYRHTHTPSFHRIGTFWLFTRLLDMIDQIKC